MFEWVRSQLIPDPRTLHRWNSAWKLFYTRATPTAFIRYPFLSDSSKFFILASVANAILKNEKKFACAPPDKACREGKHQRCRRRKEM
jgi:hypothetical protein